MSKMEVKLVERKYEFWIGEYSYSICLTTDEFAGNGIRLLETTTEGETKKIFEGDPDDFKEFAEGLNVFIEKRLPEALSSGDGSKLAGGHDAI